MKICNLFTNSKYNLFNLDVNKLVGALNGSVFVLYYMLSSLICLDVIYRIEGR